MNWIRSHVLLLFLIAFGIILAATNYTPGTFLSGWDTLHPEFNFQIAFSRAINGVWRADQGLGAVAIQSHMADLPHILFLWLESLVVPLSMLRYSFFFLMLITGPVGMYFLTKKLIAKKTASPIAFISGLTYLTNLGTVQHFIVPLEMFAAHYGLLPWILLATWTVLETWSKKSLILFAIVMLLATPQAHTATLFYAFLLIWFTCLGTYVLVKGTTFKKILTLLGITLCMNAFWLLPNIYAVAAHGKEVQQSKINRLFTPEAIAKNQEFGNLVNVPILKSFLFDWQLFNSKTNEFEEVTKAWQKNLANPIVAGFGYVAFAMSLIGIAQTIKQRNKVGIAIFPMFFISFVLLLNGTLPVNILFETVGKILPVVMEALRFPFTKFSILFMTALSFYVAEGIMALKSMSKHIVIVFSILSLWYFLSAFQGNLIHPAMRVAIPKDYFAMFQWFQKQPTNQRVAILPIHTFWGWTYYNWGYQGAGFLQFGIPQPIMDRDYNRWSKFNERYQQEMSYAIYSQNPKIIANVLAKYNIQWVLLDRSVISPGNTDASMLTWRIPALLTQTGTTTIAKNFGTDLSVYRVTPMKPTTTTILPDVTADDHFVGKTVGSPVMAFSGGTYENTDIPGKFDFPIPDLPHDQAYVVSIDSKNVQGFPLELCISNNLTGHCDLFTHLEKKLNLHTEQFVLPPLADFGTGYTLNFNNFAIHGQTTKNEIESITVSNAVWNPQQTKSIEPIFIDNHAPESGWTTWNGKPFFLPQLLEWLGFLLIPLSFILIIRYDKN